MRINTKENVKKENGKGMATFMLAVSQSCIQNLVFSFVSFMMMRKVAAGLIMTS